MPEAPFHGIIHEDYRKLPHPDGKCPFLGANENWVPLCSQAEGLNTIWAIHKIKREDAAASVCEDVDPNDEIRHLFCPFFEDITNWGMQSNRTRPRLR